MRKLKKLFLMSILSVSAFVLCGMTTANAAAFSLTNADVVCDPTELAKNGDRASCYIIGNPSATGSVHGYAIRAYSTKHLNIIGTESIITNSDTAWTEALSATETIASKPNMSDGVKKFGCVADDTASSDAKTFGCGIYYTVNSVENDAFTPATIKSEAALSQVGDALPEGNYGVLGSIIVQLDDIDPENPVSECGQLCVKVWRVATEENYENYSTCGNTNPELCGNETSNQYKCKDIHYRKAGAETGAFASYALLAACALIAVSAITLAKKNNKFSRI